MVRRYGSTEDDVFRPTPHEALIFAAVARWRHLDATGRWTQRLAAWFGTMGQGRPSDAVVDAVRRAYPMPKTYQAAIEELEGWSLRDRDLCEMIDPDARSIWGEGLDIAAGVRRDLLFDLVDHEMRLTNLADIHQRFLRYRDDGSASKVIEDALLRDIEAIVIRSTSQPVTADLPAQTLNARITDVLRADSSKADRAIAREIGCSPVTVGKVRRALGLTAAPRSVERNGRDYSFRPA